MKKIILFLFLSALTISLHAQIRFQHVFGGQAYDDVQEVIETPDGGYISCGTTESFGAGQSDILVVKTNDSGVVQWSKAYGSPGNDFGAAIKKAPAGGYILAGYSFGLSADTLTNDFLLIKINSTGTVQWSKTYGGIANDEAHGLAVMPDSGFIIAGTTASFGNVPNQAGYVVRTDLNGNMLWSKAITQNSDQQLFAIDPTDDGGCVVAGYTYLSGLRLFDIFVARLNANGTKQWVKNYGGSNAEQAFSVKQSLTGGFVVSGYSSSYGAGQEDAFILRLSENGDISWFSSYGTSLSERARSVLWGTGDGIVIGGQAKVNSAVGQIDNNFLLKTDTSGNVLWSKTFGPTINVSLAYSSIKSSDGGYVMGGITGGFGALLNDIYLVKTTDIGGSGCYQNNTQFFSANFLPTDSSGGTFTNGGIEQNVNVIKTNVVLTQSYKCNSTGVGIIELENENMATLYPNPGMDIVNLKLNPFETNSSILQISTTEGKIVLIKTIPMYTNETAISVREFKNGIYFLTLQTTNGTQHLKLVVNH